jgi:hypothetical protein
MTKTKQKENRRMHYTRHRPKANFCSTVANNISHLLLIFRFIIPKMLGGRIITSQLSMKKAKGKDGLIWNMLCLCFTLVIGQKGRQKKTTCRCKQSAKK